MAREEHATAGVALRRLLALALLLSAMAALSVGPAQAAGNSGTIKIHAQGSPPGTESNEPHVCAFDVEAFGFDEGFEGYIAFEVQGGDGPTGVAAGPYEVGPADATGYFASAYFNVAGGEVIQDGHYKVTLYGKFNGRIDYEDVKAKSKVFKVDCPAPPPPPPPPPTPVAPTAPTKSDVCEPASGPTDDRVTIPTDANFTYTLDGAPVAAGEVVATGASHTVMAVPKAGVVVKEGATTTWTFTFTKVLCVTPPPPPPPPPVVPPVTPPVVTPPVVTPPVVTPPVVTPPVVTPPEVLPEQAFGKAVGKVRVTCQDTVRARLANRTGDRVVYTLRVGTKVHRIAVRAQDTRTFVTRGPARAEVVLKVGSTRLDRVRIPGLCAAPEVLPDTGVRPTSR